MANRWYVKLGDEELGPLSDSGLGRLIEAGGIQGDTLVRSGPDAPWTPVQAVPGLMAKLARPAPTSRGGAPNSPPKPPGPRPAAPPTVVMLPAAPAPPAAAVRSFAKWELGLGAPRASSPSRPRGLPRTWRRRAWVRRRLSPRAPPANSPP